MSRAAEVFSSSVVVVGAFNPAIFSPDWLERNGLIGPEDGNVARESESIIVSHQVSVYETEWFAIQVLENRFSLTSKSALSPSFKDLAASILSLLPHTPVSAIGLNFMAHYRLASAEEYHRVGDVLAPKDIWRHVFPGDDISAGLADLTIRIQPCARNATPISGDEKRISVQPSSKVPFGVFLAYNDHHEVLPDSQGGLTAAQVATALVENDWERAMQDATRAFEALIDGALGS